MRKKNDFRRVLALTASVAIMGTSIPFNVLAESVYNEQTDKNVIVNDSNDSKENVVNGSEDKLELSSGFEGESVKANENNEPELILPEAKFDEDMSIDDPSTYDYAGYIIKHYNPTNEKFMKERNSSMFLVDDILKDNTDKKNEKIVFQKTIVEKGKDLSEKLDEFILELEKNKGNNKIDADDIQNKVFGENPGFYAVSYFSSYLGCLYSIYNSSYQGDGDGHKLITNDKLFASDFSVENFKEIYRNNHNNIQNYVIFTVNNSFRNKPIIWDYQIFLSEDQYFQYKDEIMDFIKSEVGFKNLTSRKTSISPCNYVNIDVNSQKLPNNIKNALSEEYDEENIRSSFDIIYDIKNINKDYNSFSKEDLKKDIEDDYLIDKDIVNDESFSLRVGFELSDDYKNQNILPVNYYLSENDKPTYRANSNLKFKEKSDITGSEYYISNTITDKDTAVQRLTKLLTESSKYDESFNKLSEKEKEEWIQSQVEKFLPDIDESHKDDKENIAKYQAFLNSEKWGNQRLTQYVGNVDTKIEEFDYKTIKKDDPTLEEGKTKVVTKGVKGKKVTKITYKVDRTSGELTDPVSEVIEDTKPIDEVILVGTKKVESKPEIKPEEKLPDKEIKVVGNNISTGHLNLDNYLYSGNSYKPGRKQIEKVRFDIDGNKHVERKALPVRSDIKTNKSEYPYYIFTIGDMTYIKVTEKGKEPRKMDVKPYLKNDRTMLPLRYVGEALNADVKWDNKTRTAYFTRDGITARIQIDGNKIELSNGKVFTMDAKPDNINSRIFVPITNVSQVFTLTNGNTTDEIKQNIEWSQQDYTTTVYPNR